MKEIESEQTFGCCAGIPEFLLHTGDSWDYPKWYINYLLGEGDRKLPKNVSSCLEFLKDGEWKIRINSTGIGTGSLEAACELNLIKMSPVIKPFRSFVAEEDRRPIIDILLVKGFAKEFAESQERGSFYGAYRITERGLKALEEKSLP